MNPFRAVRPYLANVYTFADQTVEVVKSVSVSSQLIGLLIGLTVVGERVDGLKAETRSILRHSASNNMLTSADSSKFEAFL